jgi:hypothetical protein
MWVADAFTPSVLRGCGTIILDVIIGWSLIIIIKLCELGNIRIGMHRILLLSS